MNRLLHPFLIRQVPLAGGIQLPDTTSLSDAVEAMREKKTACVLAMNGRDMTGIFTERDLLNRVMDEPVKWTDPIKSFATPLPVTMNEDEPLRKALFLMRKKGIRHIPIFKADGVLSGVLSIRNVIKLIAEHFPEEVLNLPPNFDSAPATAEGG